MLLTALGAGAFYAVASLGVLSFTLLRTHDLDRPIQRAIGWAMSLLGITTLFTAIAPGLNVGPVIGSGGYLGKLGQVLLEMHFATTGGLILASCVTLAGWMLCTDYTLLRLMLRIASFGIVGADAVRSRWGRHGMSKIGWPWGGTWIVPGQTAAEIMSAGRDNDKAGPVRRYPIRSEWLLT